MTDKEFVQELFGCLVMAAFFIFIMGIIYIVH
jgi:hypothetical protein